MATITPVVSRTSSGLIVKWEGVGNGDTCEPISIDVSLADKTFSATGTWDSGTIGLLGTTDPDEDDVANFQPLSDLQGAEIALDADGVVSVSQNCVRYAPSEPTGAGADLDVYLIAT